MIVSYRQGEREWLCMTHEETSERMRLAQVEQARLDMAAAAASMAAHAAGCAAQEAWECERRKVEGEQMNHEDKHSREVANDAVDIERHARERMAFLRELYTPFEPFFPDNGHLTRQPNKMMAKKNLRPAHYRPNVPQYATLPYGEALVLETPTSEVYVAQPSKKFQSLLGVPINYRRYEESKTSCVHKVDIDETEDSSIQRIENR
jgi:hypothetical protein